MSLIKRVAAKISPGGHSDTFFLHSNVAFLNLKRDMQLFCQGLFPV